MKRTCSSLFFLALGLGTLLCGCAHAQQPPAPAPAPLPPPAPRLQTLPPPATQQPMAPAQMPPPQPAMENFLAFDAGTKEVSVTNGTPAAQFTFSLTNVSPGDVIINYVHPSCGCTVAQLPATPWKLTPNETGQISATMQLAGTPPGGTKIKTLTVNTDKGIKELFLKATVLPPPAAMTEMDRTNNQKMAMADRQAVFKGSCVTCHVAPATDAAGHEKMGKDLYVAVCGVCHEAVHQASFVPNLHRLPEPTNAEFWKNWIMHGKPGTLMPAFAKADSGILSDAQVESLVQYLSATIPSHPAPLASPTSLQVKQREVKIAP